MLKKLLLAGACAAALTLPTAILAQDANEVRPTMEFGDYGIDRAAMKPAVDPGDDFFTYVNGEWFEKEEIPSDRSYSGSTYVLRQAASFDVREIIQDLAAQNNAPGSTGQRVADLYNSFLDEQAINASGLAPAKPYLDSIRAVDSREELARLMARTGYPSPLSGYVSIDENDPTRNTLFMNITGLGLPDRDNYLVDTEKNLEMRERYKVLLAFYLDKAGYAEPASAAEAVYGFERQIAQADWDRAVARNPIITNNVVTPGELTEMSGGFPLAAFFEEWGVAGVDNLTVSEILPDAEKQARAGITAADMAKLGGGFPAVMKLLNEAPLPTIQAWMAAQFLLGASPYLSTELDAKQFEFYGKYLNGTEQQRPRWQRAVSLVEGAMGEAIGEIYVQEHFPPENKAAMDELVANLLKAQEANIKGLDWMSDATKQEALKKLANFRVKVGYPPKFETYEGLKIVPGNPLANQMAVSEWSWQDSLSDLGKPVDKDKWLLYPQTVNAYYMPPANEIVFPAAYLQPPNFNAKADPAVNYGAIGVTIGHEIGHGFDDSGSRYDGTGALRNWWTDEDNTAFAERTAKLVEQYNAICPYEGVCHNGRLTLGENIGDLGGLAMAYTAYKLSLGGKEAPVIDGLSGDQRFFIAYAQSHRAKWREAFAGQLLATDPHSLWSARVNGIVRNFGPWYEAFNVTPDDELYLPPEERVKIW